MREYYGKLLNLFSNGINPFSSMKNEILLLILSKLLHLWLESSILIIINIIRKCCTIKMIPWIVVDYKRLINASNQVYFLVDWEAELWESISFEHFWERACCRRVEKWEIFTCSFWFLHPFPKNLRMSYSRSCSISFLTTLFTIYKWVIQISHTGISLSIQFTWVTFSNFVFILYSFN